MKNLSGSITTSLLFILTLFISCRPEQAAIEYAVTIKPMVGPNKALETDEDKPMRFIYSIKETLEDENKKTIDLKLSLHSPPKFGELSDCKEIEEGLAVDCLYTPKENFSGEDKILFNSKDGDFLSTEQAVLAIKVNEVPDAPKSVGDVSVSVLQGATVVFDVPLAEDVDSSAGQLQYKIEENVTNGILKCFKSDQGELVVGHRKCSYTPNVGFYGDDAATYNVKDETGLSAPKNGNIKISVTRQRYKAEELFDQNKNGYLKSVDITWVIDNSGSMKDEQEALQASFNSFVDNFLKDTNGDGVGDTAKFPFKMIVTSTEAYLNGRDKYRKNPATNLEWDLSSTLAESDFDQFKSNFNSAALMGINGSGSEKSLSSADALWQSYNQWYGKNDTLSVYIFLSDEKEQSTNKTVAEWVTQFQGLKDAASKTRFYPIIRLNQDDGKRYENMAALSGGAMYDITQPFDQILDNISLTVTNLLEAYGLEPNRELYEGTLKVYINDVQQFNGWSYVNDTITFETAPPSGSVIKVTYDYSPKA